MTPQTLDFLRNLNLNVIPLIQRSKNPSIKWQEYQIIKYDGDILQESNIGVICGQTSENLVVVDIDFDEPMLLNKILPDALTKTLVVKTGKGGHHIYIRTKNLPKIMHLDGALGHIDILSQGSFAVGPSSIHENGNQYEIISTAVSIVTVDFQEIIDRLESLGFNAHNKQTISEIKKNGAEEGTRNDAMFKTACDLLQRANLDESTAWSYLQTINEKNKPPLSESELEAIFESARKYPCDESKSEESDRAYKLSTSKIKKLVVSQNNSKEVYAVVEINGHNETFELSSKRASHWLNCICRSNQIGKIHGDEYFKNIQNAIIAQAQINNTQREKVYSRIAVVGDTLYYDLATNDWTIVRIDSNKIETIPYVESMPIFRRSQTSFEQVRPSFDNPNALDELAKLLRIKDTQIFNVHLVSLLFEHVSVPIMVFDGAAGSMKSTTTAAIKRIIDPSGIGTEDNCNSMATQNDDLILQLYNRYISAFDNVTKINQDTSDVLCRAITGSSNGRRELYTNADETILNFRRKIVLNGIVLNPDFPDLQDRMVVYDRFPLEENDRLTEQEFQEKLRVLLPAILGQILIIIQKSLSQYNNVRKQIRPHTRLADFEIWGETISRAMNYGDNSFLQKYYEKQKRTSITVKDQHPIVAAIETMMDGKENYENTIAICFRELKSIANNLGVDVDSRYVRFPRASNQLRTEITKIKPILEKIGIIVNFDHYTKSDGRFTKNSSMIYIKTIKKHDQPSLSSPTSLSDNHSQSIQKLVSMSVKQT